MLFSLCSLIPSRCIFFVLVTITHPSHATVGCSLLSRTLSQHAPPKLQVLVVPRHFCSCPGGTPVTPERACNLILCVSSHLSCFFMSIFCSHLSFMSVLYLLYPFHCFYVHGPCLSLCLCSWQPFILSIRVISNYSLHSTHSHIHILFCSISMCVFSSLFIHLCHVSLYPSLSVLVCPSLWLLMGQHNSRLSVRHSLPCLSMQPLLTLPQGIVVLIHKQWMDDYSSPLFFFSNTQIFQITLASSLYYSA